jgi:hypothetical protein
MTEQELERLRQVADRLMDANQEALEAIERMLVHEGEGSFGDDEAETAWEAEHLQRIALKLIRYTTSSFERRRISGHESAHERRRP